MKIVVIDNHLVTKMAGGTHHMITVTNNWSRNNDLNFLVPLLAFEYISSLLAGKVFAIKNPLEKIDDSMDGTNRGAFKRTVLYGLRTFQSSFFCSDNRFDVILASSHYPHDVIPAIFLHLRNPRSKIVVYAHGMFPEVPETHGTILRTVSLIHNYFGGLLAIRFADLLFVFNNHTKRYLTALGAKNKQAILTCNPIKVRPLNEVSIEKSFAASFLGRIVPSKGIFDLVEIWKKVCKKNRHYKLMIIGSGQTDLLMQAAKKANVSENIVLAGHVPDDRKFELLRSSNLFLFPSFTEGWGIAVAEAMACSLPVVAYDLPVYREVFKDKLITVRVGDVNSMANQVISLLERPEVAVKLGQANREFVMRYESNKIAEVELSKIMTLMRSEKM